MPVRDELEPSAQGCQLRRRIIGCEAGRYRRCWTRVESKGSKHHPFLSVSLHVDQVAFGGVYSAVAEGMIVASPLERQLAVTTWMRKGSDRFILREGCQDDCR